VSAEDDPFDRPDQVLGTDVGGYTIERELGRGGMGVVYAARHPMIGKRAAIKVLKPSLSSNPATVERFLQEARSVNQIGHPGIVDIFAYGSLPDGRRYLVMDLLDGESLRARVKRGPMHASEAVFVIDEIASALIAAHGKGFIHRDLKPDNVFLVAHPGRIDVKLLDFGLAKLLPGAGQRAYRTATGAQLGTPDYMSPEQLRGSDEVDQRSDTYSLGVTAFEILTGKRPRRFSDGNVRSRQAAGRDARRGVGAAGARTARREDDGRERRRAAAAAHDPRRVEAAARGAAVDVGSWHSRSRSRRAPRARTCSTGSPRRPSARDRSCPHPRSAHRPCRLRPRRRRDPLTSARRRAGRGRARTHVGRAPVDDDRRAASAGGADHTAAARGRAAARRATRARGE